MNLTLCIKKKTNSNYTFELVFENNSLNTVNLPITSFNNSGQAIGINFILNGNKIHPAGQTSCHLINPTEDDKLLGPGESIIISWNANVNKFGEQWGLEFDKATYLLAPNVTYEIYIHWGSYKSNMVKWSFIIPLGPTANTVTNQQQ